MTKDHIIYFLEKYVWDLWNVSYLLIKIFFNIPLSDRSNPFTWIKEPIPPSPIFFDHYTLEMIPDPSWAMVKFNSNLN